MKPADRSRLHYVAAILWILLTVSLASWWMFFGLEQSRQLNALGGPEVERLVRVQRMLMWEGGTFIGLLLIGGVALLVSIRHEQARQRAVGAFFMAFTHDLKTALASLQLQAESLREDLPDAAGNPNLTRLLQDTVRLGVQLENSLYFAQPEGGLFLEPIPLARFVQRIAADWPQLKVSVSGDATAIGDARGLESVLRNLFQNAVVHGGATKVRVSIDQRPDGRVTVTTQDDGRGAPSDVLRLLGQPFIGRSPTSRTGVGLFVSKQLAQRMSGDLRFERPAPGGGFTAVLELPMAGK
ncbi:MAG TPA: HAMP domain-containing sensor histidine kinase [Vicinamibacterales bacterium]|nr:HAMP domain-containing sensor histidine kinase [Vicinamibacterales bacterium]